MGKKKKDVVEAEVPVTETQTTLYSSEKGEIACKDHAPSKSSDSWRFDRWRKMTADDVAAFEKELGHKIACEACAAGPRNQETVPTDATPPVEAPAPAPTEESPKKGKRAKADITLADLADRYLASMERAEKSSGTVFSYRLELQTALAHLGADTKLADLKPQQVLAFFGSDKVLKKRNGKVKSPLSIAKTQRVLRLALVWAASAKLIEKAPLPEQAAAK